MVALKMSVSEQHSKKFCVTNANKHDILVSLLDTTVYAHTSESKKYADAIQLLDRDNINPDNEVYARHRLNFLK